MSGAFFHLCASAGTELGGNVRRWLVGHLHLLTNLVQMASPGPSLGDSAGRGACAIRPCL